MKSPNEGDVSDELEPREILWKRLDNAIEAQQRFLSDNNPVQAYFQWQEIYRLAAILKNTDKSE